VIALILAFTIGVFIFRETKAIWHMTSSNAITMNATMNMFGNPAVEVIVMILIMIVAAFLLMRTCSMGFG
jgi:hypothetical protein